MPQTEGETDTTMGVWKVEEQGPRWWVCSKCHSRERPQGTSYCLVCKGLYLEGLARMNLDKRDYNLALIERPEEVEEAALRLGKVKKLETLDGRKIVVWNRTAWDYVTLDEEARAYSGRVLQRWEGLKDSERKVLGTVRRIVRSQGAQAIARPMLHTQISAEHGWRALTHITNLLDSLVEKGALTKEKRGNTWFYRLAGAVEQDGVCKRS